MSLKPKLDEIVGTVITSVADICRFIETWLSESVPDESFIINGFQLFRRDRVGWEHRGVCMYVRDSIQCNILSDLWIEAYEVLSLDVKSSYRSICQNCGLTPSNADDMAKKD